MRFLLFLFALLMGLLFSVDFLRPGRSIRDWRQKATTLFGISGVLWAGLSLYELAHPELRYSVCANALFWVKGLLAGMAVAILVCLGLTSERNKKGGKTRETRGHP